MNVMLGEEMSPVGIVAVAIAAVMLLTTLCVGWRREAGR